MEVSGDWPSLKERGRSTLTKAIHTVDGMWLMDSVFCFSLLYCTVRSLGEGHIARDTTHAPTEVASDCLMDWRRSG